MRPLTTIHDQTSFWAGHVRVGVWISLFLGVLVVGYAVTTPIGGARTAVVTVVSVAVAVSVAQRFVPVRWLVGSRFGAAYLYAWALGGLAVVTWVAAVDGGANSPVTYAIPILLVHGVTTYPLGGRILIGAATTASFVGLHRVADATVAEALTAVGLLATLAYVGTHAGHNHLSAYTRQRRGRRVAEREATIDGLTGCRNHQSFHAELQLAATRAGPEAPVGFAIVDVDEFKAINDVRGHLAGDGYLAALGATLRSVVRDHDVVGRIGGDEFGVLVTDADAGALRALVHRIHAEVGAIDTSVTVTVGYAHTWVPMAADTLFARADRALYEAKAAGRDRVQDYEPSVEVGGATSGR